MNLTSLIPESAAHATERPGDSMTSAAHRADPVADDHGCGRVT